MGTRAGGSRLELGLRARVRNGGWCLGARLRDRGQEWRLGLGG